MTSELEKARDELQKLRTEMINVRELLGRYRHREHQLEQEILGAMDKVRRCESGQKDAQLVLVRQREIAALEREIAAVAVGGEA
ncbi:hypothetical protein D9M70_300490 [compost metagenome]